MSSFRHSVTRRFLIINFLVVSTSSLILPHFFHFLSVIVIFIHVFYLYFNFYFYFYSVFHGTWGSKKQNYTREFGI